MDPGNQAAGSILCSWGASQRNLPPPFVKCSLRPSIGLPYLTHYMWLYSSDIKVNPIKYHSEVISHLPPSDLYPSKSLLQLIPSSFSLAIPLKVNS
jgi:hypothetical protein